MFLPNTLHLLLMLIKNNSTAKLILGDKYETDTKSATMQFNLKMDIKWEKNTLLNTLQH